MPVAFVFKNPEFGGHHKRGNVRCQACLEGFPHMCRGQDCSGLMHAHNGGFQRGGARVLVSRCDRCGGHMVAA